MTEPPTDIPLWFRITALAVLLTLLVVNVVVDYVSDTYDGQYLSLGLLGVVAAGIGLAKGLRGGGSDK